MTRRGLLGGLVAVVAAPTIPASAVPGIDAATLARVEANCRDMMRRPNEDDAVSYTTVTKLRTLPVSLRDGRRTV